MVDIKDSAGNVASVVGHSFAAIIGVIAANYIATASGAGNYTQLIAGAVLIAIPSFFLRGGGTVEGPVRLAMGVAGLTLVLRSIVGPSGLLMNDTAFPAEVKAVI